MKLLTRSATLVCGHSGVVKPPAYQSFVRISSQLVLVEGDPEGVPVFGCPIAVGPASKPCTLTREVRRGYSKFVFVSGYSACRADLVGSTDGMPPVSARYDVSSPGQNFVAELDL